MSGDLERVYREHRRTLIGILTRVFGTKNLDLVETVVQDAFLRAHMTWPIEGVPDNPPGWLLKVARNKLLDHIRYRETYDKKEPELEQWANALASGAEASRADPRFKGELEDALGMMFVACHP